MEEESAVGKEGPACMRLFPSMLGLLLLACGAGRDRRLTIAELHLQAAFLTSALVFLFAFLAWGCCCRLRCSGCCCGCSCCCRWKALDNGEHVTKYMLGQVNSNHWDPSARTIIQDPVDELTSTRERSTYMDPQPRLEEPSILLEMCKGEQGRSIGTLTQRWQHRICSKIQTRQKRVSLQIRCRGLMRSAYLGKEPWEGQQNLGYAPQ